MTKPLPLAALLMALIAAMADAQGGSYSDSDWNTRFRDNCGLPGDRSVERVSIDGDQKLQFTLNKGDVGGCSTDNQPRHSAPYWERAELAQSDKLELGQRHRISAEIRLMRGFTGNREAFFQIHGWTQDCQKAYPPVMLKFHKGRLRIDTLRGVTNSRPGRHRNALRKRVNVETLYGKPMTLVLDFDTRTRPGTLSVSLNGTPLVSDTPVDFAACAEPHVKFGIYRPGGAGAETSVAVFDDLQIFRAE